MEPELCPGRQAEPWAGELKAEQELSPDQHRFEPIKYRFTEMNLREVVRHDGARD
jgi:hypothetical protein